MSEAAIWGVGVISGFPDASNTGVPPGTSLTAYSGPDDITVDDTVIDSKIISDCITINADNVVISKCQISCSTFGPVVNVQSGSLLIEDSEVDCGGLTGTGIDGSAITTVRCDITDCENGMNLDGESTVEDSYIHDLLSGGGAHTDGIQISQGADNVDVIHNTIIGATDGTSCIIMWDGGDPQVSNVLVENNRLIGTGSAATVYTPRDPPLTNVRVINNRMLPGVLYNGGDGTILTDGSGNVNDTTGDPVSLD